MKEKRIKVYLQYPWAFPDSNYYKTLISNPPENISYLNIKHIGKGATTSIKKFLFFNLLKKHIRIILNSLKLPLINAHYTKSEDEFDLIHCAHCLSKNKNKPWVADIEGGFSLQISGYLTRWGKRRIKKLLLRDNCKKILPWTNTIKEELLKEFPEIKDKIEVVYPAIPFKNIKKKSNERLKIIFVSRYFNLKCGLIALEVLERLRKEKGIEGIVVSDVPDNLKEKYSNLKIYDLLPQNELFELMESSDIFLYPSAADTFGFSLLEAMSFGLPIVTIDTKWTKSRGEIVKHLENGFVFGVNKQIDYYHIGKLEEEIICKLKEYCEILINSKEIREKMSKRCIQEIKEGKFSIKNRNKQLGRIYKFVTII
jgi:glycosyltransferase involved in cell wall biosynthesis